MCGAVGVPDPVVGVERCSAVLMHLAVIGAEIASVLAQAHGALERAIIRGVEHRLLVVTATRNADFRERRVPRLSPRLLDGSKIKANKF